MIREALAIHRRKATSFPKPPRHPNFSIQVEQPLLCLPSSPNLLAQSPEVACGRKGLAGLVEGWGLGWSMRQGRHCLFWGGGGSRRLKIVQSQVEAKESTALGLGPVGGLSQPWGCAENYAEVQDSYIYLRSRYNLDQDDHF